MHPTHPRRSKLVTIIALIFLSWGAFALAGIVFSKAWDPDAGFWDHSDASWARIYLSSELIPEHQELTAAQERAQLRYELPMKAVFSAWSLVTLVASLGLLRRKNWARLLFIGVMVTAAVGITWSTVLFTSLRIADTSDKVVVVVMVLAFCWIAWKLRSPSILSEFRKERA